MNEETTQKVLTRLERIEMTLAMLVQRQAVKDWYTTEEIAKLLGNKSEFTVREWCRLSRIHAQKKGSGRGKHQAWVISHQELLRIQRAEDCEGPVLQVPALFDVSLGLVALLLGLCEPLESALLPKSFDALW